MFLCAVQYWYVRHCYSAGTCFCFIEIGHFENGPEYKCAFMTIESVFLVAFSKCFDV